MGIRLLRRAAVGEEGSVLLALATVIVLTGVMLAIMTTVMLGQRATRHEQRYTSSGQGADAGVQQAFYQVNSLPADSTATSLSSNGPVTIGNATYTWSATRPAADSLIWSVTSTSTAATGVTTTTRTVTATIKQAPLFNMAAFADSSINFNGNNSAVSYPVAGQGDIGTNGTLTLKGASTTVDGITLYDYDANPNPSRCSGSACSSPTSTIGTPLNIGAALGTGFIQTQIDACKQSGPLTAFIGSSIAASPTPYCFTSFQATTQNFTVTGIGTAKIYVDGGDVVLGDKNHSDVNNDVPGSPTSIKLQIYTTGQTVSMYNQGNLSAAIYAPNAACGGVTSNAGTDFYGSMICKTIDNVGGWTFHYDTRLASIGDGTWRVKDYSEPGT
jgi:hypothetical protein